MLYDPGVISAAEVATIEAWASSSYPDRGDAIRVLVRVRGLDVNIMEERLLPAGTRARSLVRLRYLPDIRLWTVHRLFGGGRWLPAKPPDGPLGDILDRIDLALVPHP